MQILYTKHAKDRAAFYCITKEQIKKAIKQGSTYSQTDGFLAVHGGLCVAYKRRGEYFRIKTVFVK